VVALFAAALQRFAVALIMATRAHAVLWFCKLCALSTAGEPGLGMERAAAALAAAVEQLRCDQQSAACSPLWNWASVILSFVVLYSATTSTP